MLKSISDEWTDFSEIVFRGMSPCQVQRREMKKAFFAGAFVMMETIKEIGDGHISDQEGIDHLASIEVEILEFMKSMIRRDRERN